MCKKLGIVGLILAGVMLLLGGFGLLSYPMLYMKKIQRTVSDNIPPEMKIERLREEVKKLEPDMARQRSAVARESVEVAALKKQIAVAKANLKDRETQLKDMRAHLKAGDVFVTIGNHQLPRDRVEATLARQWESFKDAEGAVKSQDELLQSREDNLQLAMQKLEIMESKRQELTAKVDRLDSELRKLRLAQVKNDVVVDDSQLSRVNQLYDEVDKQIATGRTELEMQKGVFTDTVVEKALAEKAKEDKAFREMDERFSTAAQEKETAQK